MYCMQIDFPPVISGLVERGRQLGRQLGFPTANVAVAPHVGARFGVYATRTLLADGRRFAGVASLGVNPTVGGREDPVLEVWLFDFDEDIYGQWIETELVAFLRDELRFADLDILSAQVRRDAEQARQLLADRAMAD